MKESPMNINQIKECLTNKIFTKDNRECYLFSDNTYAILPENIGDLVKRNDIIWPNINPKYTYLLYESGRDIIFRTYKNELNPEENEFLISINDGDTRWKVLLTPVHFAQEQIVLFSE